MTLSADRTCSLVPPHRLGFLLSERRTKAELPLAIMARLSTGRFTVSELSELEAGRFPLTDEVVRAVTDLYELSVGPVVPERTELVIDLGLGTIEADEWTERFESSDADDLLSHYLALVYVMRGVTPGRVIQLRANDVRVLGQVLSRTPETVESQLAGLMTADEIRFRSRSLRDRVSIPGIGLLVGMTSMGFLVMAPMAGADAGYGGPGPAGPDELTMVAESGQFKTNPLPGAITGLLPPSEVGAQAEQTIDYDFRAKLPGWTIDYQGPRTGYRGLTKRSSRTITIYVEPDDTVDEVAGVLAHELGHAFDLEYLSSDDRMAWAEARGIETQWWVDNGLSDFQAGQGDFAEAVAALLVGSASDSEHGAFTPDQLDLAAALLP